MLGTEGITVNYAAESATVRYDELAIRAAYGTNVFREGPHDGLMESTCAFASDDFWCGVYIVRHFRLPVSALRNACCACAGQSVADLRQSPRLFDGNRVVHRRWVFARRAFWNRVGILEQKTGVR